MSRPIGLRPNARACAELGQASLARAVSEWVKGKVPARNPHGAFLGWVKRFTKGKAAA